MESRGNQLHQSPGRCSHLASTATAAGSLQLPVLQRIRDYVHEHMSGPIEVAHPSASLAGRSPYHFTRVFARSIGMTPYRYVVHLRLQAAIGRIRGGMSLAEVAADTGFSTRAICLAEFVACTASRHPSSPESKQQEFSRTTPAALASSLRRAGQIPRPSEKESIVTNPIARNSKDIAMQLPRRYPMPGDERYASATTTWAKQRGVAPRFVVHCRTASDVQAAIRMAREQNLPLSVRGGGHDWAGRALCDGVVIDLMGMRSVILDSDRRAVTTGGGVLVSDIAAVTDAHGVAVVVGSVGSVGMTGLTLGGGYGPLIGRFGLALDNVLDMQIVMADGRIDSASAERNEELFWALRGGRRQFRVVTATRHLVHELPGVHSGMLVYPFSEASVGARRLCGHRRGGARRVSVQVGIVGSPDGSFVVAVIPTWCGASQQGDSQLAPMLRLGTLLTGTIDEILRRTASHLRFPRSRAIAGVS